MTLFQHCQNAVLFLAPPLPMWTAPRFSALVAGVGRTRSSPTVEIKDGNCSGVIFAHGSRFGGHSLFIKDKKLPILLGNHFDVVRVQRFVGLRRT